MKQAKDLTREETIKALRLCSTARSGCELCPLRDHVHSWARCYDNLMAHAAELLGEASYE